MKLLIILWALSLALLVALSISLFFYEDIIDHGINPRVFKMVGWSGIGSTALSGALIFWEMRK